MNISEELFFADNWKRIMCKRGRGPVCRICFLFEKALVEKRRRVRGFYCGIVAGRSLASLNNLKILSVSFSGKKIKVSSFC